MSALQPFDCGANRSRFSAIPLRRECIDRAQKKSQHRRAKEFRHRHPIDFPPHCYGYEKRIEMTNVICRQQKSAAPICVLASDDTNTYDAAKQQFHQQFSSSIKCCFDFHLLSVSLLSCDRKAIFSGCFLFFTWYHSCQSPFE